MDLLAALRLQIEWGADEALADEPIDRLRLPTPENGHNGSAHEKAGRGFAPPAPPRDALPELAASSGGTPAALAEVAASANTVDELQAALAGFTGCTLRD